MSENTNPETLVKTVHFTLQRDTVIPTPVDPTLTNPGEAADAYATGVAIANALNGANVNGKAFQNKAIILYGSDIYITSEQGAQTIAEAIEGLMNQDASGIMYDASELITVKDALDEINDDFTAEEAAEIIEEVYGGEE